MPRIYQHTFIVPEQAMDENGHVNNVEYVRWMQQAAELHAQAEGCTQATRVLGAAWVVRTHRIEYFKPAFAHEKINLLTWVSNWRRARSLRKYKFLRDCSDEILAVGETDWIFVDGTTGRPRAIPKNISNMFELLSEREESREIETFLRGCG
ncbi:MAG: acyl-CoA thioesterase [Xenococcaceae cyanobacterium MO_188.B29]|nr:acyl-CoA thioesterase [Xenococcaceae cyanobacterium MO_188.B29]